MAARWLLGLVSGWLVLAPASPAAGFPPYRSTDAETANEWTIEARLGLLRAEWRQGAKVYQSPLWRVNLGLPYRLELVTEGQWDASAGRFGDAAVGLKWVPLPHSFSLGVEALALLPVSSRGGSGTEIQMLATWRRHPVLVHANAGGFYDARPSPTEKGWRGSLLSEVELGRWRPGLELFARRVAGGSFEPLAGAGAIVAFGPLDLRAAVHLGLTDAAPDVVASLWISTELPLVH